MDKIQKVSLCINILIPGELVGSQHPGLMVCSRPHDKAKIFGALTAEMSLGRESGRKNTQPPPWAIGRGNHVIILDIPTC
jgi:hypothetical protein